MVRVASLYMLDTDICIYFRRGRSQGLTDRFASLTFGQAIMSVVTYGELRHGAEKSDRRDRNIEVLEALVGLYPVEDLTVEVARRYAEIRAELERRGELIGQNDLWIAAHAQSLGLTLVTNNEREFRRIPGLTVENWSAA